LAPPFHKVLIANRGEIAVRISRACHALGIRVAAVHSEAERDALHVRAADEAYACGPAPARDSYLRADRILEIAKACGADAIHPGYGFLSENADFAERCAGAGIAWIGPPAEVIRRMGDKAVARRAMAEAGVPVVPGATERLTDAEVLSAAQQLGFPVMVKATGGGGGRGMRAVRAPGELDAALARARSEAGAGFGDDGVYVEKLIESARHVEVQLLADAHGHALHLFERDCSSQRRHQKLVEEAPAPGLSPQLRERLGAAALRAARAVSYSSAGTVEFLLAPDEQFYFLEMNTRIQVEHPVSEAVTGIDLVEAMIRVAAGEPLGLRQEDVRLRGHAIEARIYAEDPARGFLPSPGRLSLFRPPTGPGLRVDAGVETGAEVTVHYDALLAKLVAFGETRDEALARLDAGLSGFAVAGVRTSIPFQRWLLRQDAFRAGRVDIGFVERSWPKGGAGPLDAAAGAAALAAARAALGRAPALPVHALAPDWYAVEAAGGRCEAAVTVRAKVVDVLLAGDQFSFDRAQLAA
jgi:acetyl-CoA carboxylase biotin carboxylase subunit